MSSAALEQSHLQRRPLSGSNIKDILSQLGKWLEGAVFEDDGTLEKCADPGLDEACKSLFVELGVYEKIQAKQRITYNVLRLRKPNTAQFLNPTHSADLVPIRVIEGKPAVSGRPLIPGWITHITEDVAVSWALEFLVIVYY